MVGKVNIGAALSRIRGKRTQHDLAAISGVAFRTIQDIEQGKSTNPTMNTILALCAAAGASPIDFLKDAYPDLSKTEPIIERDPGDISSAEAVQLITGFARAGDARKAIALFLLSPKHGDVTKHFRHRRIPMSYAAAVKLRELLGEIEKLIEDDQV